MASDIKLCGERLAKLGLPLCAVLLLAALDAGVAEKPWLEVRSPHFRVLTDASAGDARRVAHEFEQMRAVFAGLFPDFRLESGAPLVLAVHRRRVLRICDLAAVIPDIEEIAVARGLHS